MHFSPVLLYDESNIDQYEWPQTDDGRKGRDYLVPLIKRGVGPYLQNVSTQLLLVVCEDVFLPFTVNEKEYENSYIASNYYALQYYKEHLSKNHPLLLRLQKPFLSIGGAALKLAKVNKMIFLNNWLMTNSLAPKITTGQLGSIVDFLTKRYSSHTLIFRNVDKCLKEDLLDSMHKNQFHLLKTRDIFLYDPEEKSSYSYNMRKTFRKDLRLMEKHNLRLIPSEQVLESHYPRILELYEMLYVEKYTKYSPRYTVEYIKHTHQNKIVDYVLLEHEGVIEGYFSYFTFNHSMMNCLFGYNVASPISHDLYKLLTRLVLEESEKLGLILNDGSGGDAAKIRRGLKPSSEYMGLYSHHLPMPRRLLWNSVAYFYKIINGKYERKI